MGKGNSWWRISEFSELIFSTKDRSTPVSCTVDYAFINANFLSYAPPETIPQVLLQRISNVCFQLLGKGHPPGSDVWKLSILIPSEEDFSLHISGKNHICITLLITSSFLWTAPPPPNNKCIESAFALLQGFVPVQIIVDSWKATTGLPMHESIVHLFVFTSQGK